jgi:carboxylate-amine ligase
VVDGFGRRFTIGVEEELFLVDRETLELAPGASELVRGREPRLKTELFECIVETTTGVCESEEEVLAELRERRAEVRELAAASGLELLASATHPFSGNDQPIVQEERYATMLAELGDVARRQLVCGLHVHVGMPDLDACLRALEGLRPVLPALLELSANSPYVEGVETGLASSRTPRLHELPYAGAPPVLRSAEDWEAAVAASGRDYTRLWWDMRPHPRLGTLEVRVMDQQTDVRRSAALAGLVAALARRAVEGHEASLDGLPAALQGPPEAARQLEVGRADGLRAVAADVVSRSRE